MRMLNCNLKICRRKAFSCHVLSDAFIERNIMRKSSGTIDYIPDLVSNLQYQKKISF